jgi:hypothetical protein
MAKVLTPKISPLLRDAIDTSFFLAPQICSFRCVRFVIQPFRKKGVDFPPRLPVLSHLVHLGHHSPGFLEMLGHKRHLPRLLLLRGHLGRIISEKVASL